MEENSEEKKDNEIEPTETSNKGVSKIDRSKMDESAGKAAKESTRSEIASFYVYAFFATIGLTFIIGFLKCFEVNDFKEMLITISGILSGPLGFIIGYYFKSESLKD